MSTEIMQILTDKDHEAALKEINRLWGAQRGTPDGDRLKALASLVETYEKKHFPIGEPTPDEARRFRREQMGFNTDE